MVFSDLAAWMTKCATRSSRIPGCRDFMRSTSSTVSSQRQQDTDALQGKGKHQNEPVPKP